jgi:hypothetical protein
MVGIDHISEQSDGLAWWDADALANANIVSSTGLATDFLNLFNEAVMLFGLLPDMPDMIDELALWQGLSYEQHFARSGFQAKELAILAYQNADPAIKVPFDALSQETCDFVENAIAEAMDIIASNRPIGEFVAETTEALNRSILALDGMVHGGASSGVQDDIDALFD